MLLALLLGFYLGGNLTSFVLLIFPGGRPLMVLCLVVLLALSLNKMEVMMAGLLLLIPLLAVATYCRVLESSLMLFRQRADAGPQNA